MIGVTAEFGYFRTLRIFIRAERPEFPWFDTVALALVRSLQSHEQTQGFHL